MDLRERLNSRKEGRHRETKGQRRVDDRRYGKGGRHERTVEEERNGGGGGRRSVVVRVENEVRDRDFRKRKKEEDDDDCESAVRRKRAPREEHQRRRDSRTSDSGTPSSSTAREEEEEDLRSISSLSLSPSPERRRALPSPPRRTDRGRTRSGSWTRHSPGRRTPPPPPQRRFSNNYYDDRREGASWGSYPPRRSSFDNNRQHRGTPPQHHHHQPPTASWESKVEAFVQGLMKKSPSPPNGRHNIEEVGKNDANAVTSAPPESKSKTPVAEVKKESKELRPPGLEDEEPEANADEELKVTPLVRYVGRKLTAAGNAGKKGRREIVLHLEGVFQYSLVSLLSRGEWVAAKTMELLGQAGYTESSLYLMATTRGGPALETELKSAVFTQKVPLGNNPKLVAQVLRVVELVVRYFTAKGDEDSDDGDEEGDDAGESSGKAVRVGMADTLKQLAVDADDQRAKERKASAEKEEDEPPAQAPVNPWTCMWDHIQADNLRSLSDMKSFVAKELLRLGDDKLCEQGKAFDVAQDMVVCLVLAGYNHGNLVSLVMQTPAEDILPPKDGAPAAQVTSSNRGLLFEVVLDRLNKMGAQLPKMTDYQLQFLVRRCLLYVMRGCDKKPPSSGGPPAPTASSSLPPPKASDGTNIVFNYLPPGLREMEEKSKRERDGGSDEKSGIEEGQTPSHKAELEPEERESTDPLNSILKPSEDKVRDPNELPARKYLFGAVHVEWIVLNGKPQVYEISVFMGDMSSTTLYLVPDALQSQSETLSNLNFVMNPDRKEFYYVQVGVGCVRAHNTKFGLDQLAKFLEEKRYMSASENKNNGLVIGCYSEEELAVFAKLLEDFGHRNLLLDSVKGLACMEHFIERNRSKKLSYSGPSLRIASADCFYDAEVRRGLAVSKLVSRSKGEAAYYAFEAIVEAPPNYKNFIRQHAFPAFSSPKVQLAKQRLRQAEEMYPLEVTMAARLQEQRVELFTEGAFQPRLGGKDLRDKASVVAGRMCRLLVEAGFDMATLAKCYAKDRDYAINSNVILDRMVNMAQRLKVTHQTMGCLGFLREYFTAGQS